MLVYRGSACAGVVPLPPRGPKHPVASRPIRAARWVFRLHPEAIQNAQVLKQRRQEDEGVPYLVGLPPKIEAPWPDRLWQLPSVQDNPNPCRFVESI